MDLHGGQDAIHQVGSHDGTEAPSSDGKGLDDHVGMCREWFLSLPVTGCTRERVPV